MEVILSEISKSALIGLVLLLGAFFVWSFGQWWTSRNKADEKRDFVLQQNTIALIELKSELKNLNSTLSTVHRRVENLEDDVDALHVKARGPGPNGSSQ